MKPSRPVAAIATLGIALLAAPLIPASAALPQESGLSTGLWSGTLSVYAVATVSQAGMNSTQGTGSIIAEDGPAGVTGQWALNTQAFLVADPSVPLPAELNGIDANVKTEGSVRGDRANTILEPDGVLINLPNLGSMEVGPEMQIAWRLDATNIGCTQVSGDFVNTTRDLAPTYGVDFSSLSGTYSMTKDNTVAGDQRAEFTRQVQELNRQFMAMFDALGSGGDLAGLSILLQDAEALGRQRQADATCISGGAIENLLASEVWLMLTRFIDRGVRGDAQGQLDAAEWNQLLTAARRTGVFQGSQWVSGNESQRLAGVLAAQIAAETARRGGPDAAAARTALMNLALGATAAGLTTEANTAFAALR